MTKKTFGTTKELREYLVSLGFPPIRATQTNGNAVANGLAARWRLSLLSRTGQSSRGAAASWGFIVTVEEAA